MTEAVYRVAGRYAHASANAAGPWDPSFQHGAAPAALVAWAAERLATDVPMTVARLTLDLLRPVPVGPLEIRTELVRQGRKIQLASVFLAANGVEVARASILKIRTQDLALPAGARAPALDLPGPELGYEPPAAERTKSAFLAGISIRRAGPSVRRPGPAAVWFRADRAIVEGEPVTPLMRAAMTADFCNGASAVLDASQWTFINGDISLNLTRMPRGEWILLDAETWLDPAGGGIASARLADRAGYFGRAAQSLVVERR